MSCNSSKSTIRGKYDKVDNLKKPISYSIDKKGNVKPIYKNTKND